jgi:NAD(P)-dependent dehydrogenase (short-subunit alcohol dehydrogenase family)
MMKNLALEWGPTASRHRAGPIEGTEEERLAGPGQEAAFIKSIPLRRMGTVDDIGQAAVFLASPLASYISGCVLVCDGGQNLAGSAVFNAGVEAMLLAHER